MIPYGTKRASRLLSLYLDNELEPKDRHEVEQLLERSPEARAEFEALRRMKRALGASKPVAQNTDFYAELHRRLPRPVYREEKQPLIPRKFVPAFAGAATLALTALALVAVFNSATLMDFFTKTGKNVQQAYEENVVQGWIMPLFERTDRDEALQYAMFGVLPLDDSSNTVLKVTNTADEGYSFELGQSNQPRFEPVTVEDLYREVEPTETQRRILDTIFQIASRQIEEGVLVDENEKIAISPSVIDLQRSLIAKVAASLDSKRRSRMERFLETRNASYAVRATGAPPVSRTTLVRQLSENSENNTFVMISRDTILLSELSLDRAKLREHASRAHASQRRMRVEFEKLAEHLSRRFAESTPPPLPSGSGGIVVARSVSGGEGAPGMRVRITVERTGNVGSITAMYTERRNSSPKARWVQKNSALAPASPGTQETHIELKMEMDSMLSMQAEALRVMEEQLRQLDTGDFPIQFEEGNLYLNLDSLERILRITSDSMHIELRNMPGLRIAPPDTGPEPGSPPGIEIRPDYYEEQQKQRDGQSHYYMLDQYREKLRNYKQQHELLKKVTSGSTENGGK